MKNEGMHLTILFRFGILINTETVSDKLIEFCIEFSIKRSWRPLTVPVARRQLSVTAGKSLKKNGL